MTAFHSEEFSAMSSADQDQVINPRHYKITPEYEYMNIMEHTLGFEGTLAHLRGQIFKYMFRLGQKDALEQDAKKIQWYSNYMAGMIVRHGQGEFPWNPATA